MSGGSSLAGRTILAVFAHPDDESLACGGTLARAAEEGARVVLICASRGGRGSVSDPALIAHEELGDVRARELADAARVLGIHEVLLFDHPDGSLRWADVQELHDEIVGAIERFRPDAVITFAEDGLYWHLDHVGVHERTKTAVQSLGESAPALYYVTLPGGMMRRVVDRAIDRGGDPSVAFWGILPDAFGSATRRPSFVVDVRRWVPRKLNALLCHRTQMGPRNPLAWLEEADAQLLLGVEQFRRARPHTGRAVLEPLGEAVVKPKIRRRA
jgi:LmbE family N-acetylglucosaminyl deacetylase